MSENIYRRARIPLYYPLVFLLNVALIIAIEVLLIYKHPVPLTEAVLNEQSPVYENAVITADDYSGYIQWYLTETETGEYHLIPARRHTLFTNRCKILTDQITVIPPDTAQMEVQTRTGITGATVQVGTDVEPWDEGTKQEGLNLRSKYHGYYNNGTGQYAIGGYFLLGVLLSLLESFLWNKIKGSI